MELQKFTIQSRELLCAMTTLKQRIWMFDTKTKNLDVLAMYKEQKSDINSEDIKAHETKTRHVRIDQV